MGDEFSPFPAYRLVNLENRVTVPRGSTGVLFLPHGASALSRSFSKFR